MREIKNGETLTTMKKTIPEAQKILVQLTQAISQNTDGRWRDGIPDHTAGLILGLDDILKKVHDDLKNFLKPSSKTESDHTVAKILGMCCCLQWRARRIRGMGDFCPDCEDHGEQAGMVGGEIKIIRPPRSIWKKKRV